MLHVLNKIRFLLKRGFDKINNEQVKTNILQALPFWLASLLTGLVAVGYAKLFDWAQLANSRIFASNRWLLFIITPLCFITAWWMVKRFAFAARGSGIPQVMAALSMANPKEYKKIGRLLNLKIIVVKIISSLTFVFGGGAIGREGPTIQVGGAIARQVNQWLPHWWPKFSNKNLIMSGAAGGLAAAFNTPLGGIVFAVEELAKTHINYFKTAVFSAVIIAGLTAQAFLGPYLYLGYPNVNNLSKTVFLLVILIAILTGLLGSIMSRTIYLILKWKRNFRFRYQHILYLAGTAVLITGLAIFIDHGVMGSGKGLIETALFTQNKHVSWDLSILRIFGPIISFTTGAAGGIFAPSLSAGASVGSLFAGWLDLSAADTNIIILAGMVGFLTGVTRTPFTSAILVLEMTDRHSVIFHLMLAGMVASIASLIIDSRSFYDRMKLWYLEELGADKPDEEIPEDVHEGAKQPDKPA